MKIYLDTSALIKNYIEESGSDVVTGIMHKADNIYVSYITRIECISTFRRILRENNITAAEYKELKAELLHDVEYFTEIENKKALENCEEIIDKYQLKTLDSIQLSSAIYIKDDLDIFICCDIKLNDAAGNERLPVYNPME
ncbi:MAG: type II toxin-antitoxin system VapC family toxin [Spirochaetes bacterium]|nr:type II toxin-antitoxin system VapC family toxin [Spirochaetota bacterium]